MITPVVDIILGCILVSGALGCLAFMVYSVICIDHNSRMFINDLDEHDKAVVLEYKSVSPFKWRKK